ncbi:MAG TPA: biopolymer transporter ExbD [Gemmatimonadaceae bacterium]|nr:biopolymer transporter ExbD [Gemmatimonadaceae bacterium]
MMNPADGRAMSAEINVTPMIDVMLVLLIIFMITLPRRHMEKLQLPVESPSSKPSTPIVLEVLPGREYRLNKQPTTEASLGTVLRDAYVDRPEKHLFIAGSPLVRYQDVITAIDSARGAGVIVFGIPPKR